MRLLSTYRALDLDKKADHWESTTLLPLFQKSLAAARSGIPTDSGIPDSGIHLPAFRSRYLMSGTDWSQRQEAGSELVFVLTIPPPERKDGEVYGKISKLVRDTGCHEFLFRIVFWGFGGNPYGM
jgi:hypothetical protein